MFTKILTKLGFTKEETSWILYDVGNSAQVLTTCTVIFPLLIAKITPGDSSVYVGWANAIIKIKRCECLNSSYIWESLAVLP